jgi:hypothetical protein
MFASQNLERVPEKKKKPDVVAVDATLARHLNFIFAPSDGKEERVKQWLAKHPRTGRKVLKKIATRAQLGSRELWAFLTLAKLRQESDGPDVLFSLQGAADIAQLDWKGRGKLESRPRTKDGRPVTRRSTPENIRDALMTLRFAGLILSNVYYDEESGEFLNVEEGVTILDRLRVVQRTPTDAEGNPDPERATLQSLFRFNPLIERSITGGSLKPIVLDALLSIDKRATAAVYAYLYLDRKLYKRTVWKEPSADFLKNIGLAGNYRRPAERRRVLDTIAKHLDGLQISTGWVRVRTFQRKGEWHVHAMKLRSAGAIASENTTSALPADRPTGSPRARYEQHLSDHPDPVSDCEDCKTVTALLKIGSLRRPATAPPGESAATQPEAPAIEPTPPNPLTHEGEPDPAPAGARPPGEAPGSIAAAQGHTDPANSPS